jgi:RHS repeat-associated protein
MAIVNMPVGKTTNKPTLEHPIYGASRLGIYNKQSNTGVYQFTDHLGNVRAVASKTPKGIVSLSSATDYYPGGMAMPNRIYGANGYRYAYQGQEVDPETGKEAFQLRLWDGRIGRWLTTDPYRQFSSPYLGMGNNPISMIDPDGGYTGWLGAALAWVSGGFKGSIDHVGGKGNKNYAISKFEFGEGLDSDGSIMLGAVRRDYGSIGSSGGNKLYWTPLPGATIHPDDMRGSSFDGVSISLEFASPIDLTRFNPNRRDDATPVYGYGFSLGSAYTTKGGNEIAGFFAFKRATSPSISLGLSVDYIKFVSKNNDPNIAKRFAGPGKEFGGNLIFSYSVGVDSSDYRPNSFSPTFNTNTYSIGVGLDFGFSEWTTRTSVFGN